MVTDTGSLINNEIAGEYFSGDLYNSLLTLKIFSREMNFFKRRRVLRNTSFLDLTPVRVNEHESGDNGLLVLIVPKFKSTRLSRFMIPGTKSSHFKIQLDELGSSAWLAIDGNRNVKALCEFLVAQMGDKLQPFDEAESRVLRFLSQLYDQRYITFREIQDK